MLLACDAQKVQTCKNIIIPLPHNNVQQEFVATGKRQQVFSREMDSMATDGDIEGFFFWRRTIDRSFVPRQDLIYGAGL